jgi:hypothetical protein
MLTDANAVFASFSLRLFLPLLHPHTLSPQGHRHVGLERCVMASCDATPVYHKSRCESRWNNR